MSENLDASQWTLATLREYLLAIIQTNDARYSERFESSQTALNAALTAQQTAMQTAFTAQKLSVDAALAAADRAVNKAEVASEKRFEGVNEFRNTLADQQRTLMPRAEAEFADRVLAEKMDAMTKTLTEKMETMSTTLTAIAAQKTGSTDTVSRFIAVGSLCIGFVGVAASIITILILH